MIVIPLQSFQYISVDCTTPEITLCGWWVLLLCEAKIVMCQKFVIMWSSSQANKKFVDRKHLTSGVPWPLHPHGALNQRGISVALYLEDMYFSDVKAGCVIFAVALDLPQKLPAPQQEQLLEQLYCWKHCGLLRRNGKGVITSSSYLMAASFYLHAHLLP